MKKLGIVCGVIVCLMCSGLLYASIDSSDSSLGSFLKPKIVVNPYKNNELVALVRFKTDEERQISVTIKGMRGAADVHHTFAGFRTSHSIPIIGLFPNAINQVILSAVDQAGRTETSTVGISVSKIRKRALIFKTIKKDTATRVHFLLDGIAFDEFGNIRFSFDNKGELVYFMKNELISESRTGGLKRYSLVGELKQSYPYPDGFTSFTHGIGQKDNKNFLVIGSFKDAKVVVNDKVELSHRDFIIELDYQTGQAVKMYDIASLLNPNRSVIVEAEYNDYGMNDWCHLNGVDYDAEQDVVVASCRHSGMFAIEAKTGLLKWILSPNIGWEQSGRTGEGPALFDKVLTAVDSRGQPYPSLVQQGYQAVSDFKWPTKNHDVKAYGNGIYSLFDNSGTVFDQKIATTEDSVASVWQVKQGKVRQLWRQNLGFFSSWASSVVYSPAYKDVTVFAARVFDENQHDISTGIVRRYDFKTHELLFEALISRGGTSYFYRVDGFSFYPDK